MSDRPPLLITGTHRSGSSWLAHILSHAPELGWIDEPLGTKMAGCYSKAVMPVEYFHIGTFNEAAYKSAVSNLLRLRPPALPTIAMLNSGKHLNRWRRARRRLNTYRKRGVTPLIKQPGGIFLAQWMADTFGVQVLIIVRHPAAYVNSCKKMGWHIDFGRFAQQQELMASLPDGLADEVHAFAAEPGELVDSAALLWKVTYASARDMLSRNPDWLYVRHETLSLDPLATARALHAQLGLTFTEACATFIRDSSGAHNPATVAPHAWKSVHRDSRALVEAWRTALSAEEIGRIRARTEPVATHFYPDTPWT